MMKKPQHESHSVEEIPQYYMYYCMANSLSNDNSSSALPAPITTAVNGSSATTTGSPVSSRNKTSRLRKSAPPPASTIPLSTISDANSGGVRSKAIRTASTI